MATAAVTATTIGMIATSATMAMTTTAATATTAAAALAAFAIGVALAALGRALALARGTDFGVFFGFFHIVVFGIIVVIFVFDRCDQGKAAALRRRRTRDFDRHPRTLGFAVGQDFDRDAVQLLDVA